MRKIITVTLFVILALTSCFAQNKEPVSRIALEENQIDLTEICEKEDIRDLSIEKGNIITTSDTAYYQNEKYYVSNKNWSDKSKLYNGSGEKIEIPEYEGFSAERLMQAKDDMYVLFSKSLSDDNGDTIYHAEMVIYSYKQKNSVKKLSMDNGFYYAESFYFYNGKLYYTTLENKDFLIHLNCEDEKGIKNELINNLNRFDVQYHKIFYSITHDQISTLYSCDINGKDQKILTAIDCSEWSSDGNILTKLG